MALHWRANQLGHPRVALVVSSRVGGAVRRNLVRRRLREAARPLLARSELSVDLVLVARPAAAAAPFAELEAEFRALATQVLGL
jgi:ribonuclease P protein component